MKKWLTPLFAALIVAMLAGCASNSEIIATGLRIQLTQIRAAADGSVEVSWRVNNPNVVPYLVDRSSHKILLNGEAVGTVVDNTRVGLPPQSGVDRKAALTPANAAAAQRIAAAAGQESVNYRVDTTIWLLLVDDELEKASLTASGSVPVSGQ